MSEKIKLKVPAKPEYESVGQGYLRVDLVPNAIVEVDNRKLADWLILNHGLKEVKPRTKAEKPNEFSFGYPPEFPGRTALIAAQIPHETTLGLMAEQLATIPGIGAETAAQITAISGAFSSPVEAVKVESEADDESEDQGGNENTGGAE